MKTTSRTVEEYIESLGERSSAIRWLHEQIIARMPSVVPKLWEGTFWGGSEQAIIGYGDLVFTRSDKKTVEWFMVGLSLQKNYISVYICATEDGKYIVKKHGAQLGKAKIGSSSISFKQLEDIDAHKLLGLVDMANVQLEATAGRM